MAITNVDIVILIIMELGVKLTTRSVFILRKWRLRSNNGSCLACYSNGSPHDIDREFAFLGAAIHKERNARRVVITGLGGITPLAGKDIYESFEKVCQGETGVGKSVPREGFRQYKSISTCDEDDDNNIYENAGWFAGASIPANYLKDCDIIPVQNKAKSEAMIFAEFASKEALADVSEN